MALTAERLRDALRAVRFPGFNRDIVRLGMVADLALEDGTVRVHLRPGTDRPEVLRQLAADVYGPSLPIMFGTAERPHATAAKRIQPLERYGIRLISMGFFLDEQSPVIWRGPLVMGIVRQFLRDVDWGPTDFLVVDLPPGT